MERATRLGHRVAGAAWAPAPPPADGVLQRRLGFEIEMLALVDIDGRPIPEKTALGTAGGANVEMTVDHGPAVAAPTPRAAHAANFQVPAAGAGGGPLALGAYDTPLGTETQMVAGPAAPAGADLRPALGNLAWGAWQGNLATVPRGRAQFPDNGPFAQIDNLVQQYRGYYRNWEPVAAQGILAGILAQISDWRARNPNARTRFLRRDSNQRRTQRYNAADAELVALDADVTAHRAFWLANPAPPANFQREYRTPLAAGGMGAWGAAHPTYAPHEGMGTDRYASILELVTPGGPGFEPENAAGQANILAAVTDAVNLAAAIENSTAHFTNRVRLSTVGGVNAVTNANIFVGNPAQPAQTTDASFQATMAIDLAQIASFFKSTVAAFNRPQSLFELKHHSDPGAAGGMGVPPPRRSVTEMARAPLVAQNIIRNHLQGALGGGWAANPTHLRGLFTLICQYLLMGRHFYVAGVPNLDKNIVPLLSRNDLGAVLFHDLVPPAEQALVTAGGALAVVNAAILAETGRTAGSALFNQAADDLAPGAAPPFDLSCTQFIDNVLSGQADGVTAHLGGFRQFALPEGIDPAGARGGEYSHPGGGGGVRPGGARAAAGQREGAIFEMRNMIPSETLMNALNLTDERFPHTQWLALATHMVEALAALNARTTAQSATDTRFRQATGVLHDEAANW